ncbi:ABC-type glycerol-3-phosphate transport system substrate-binding protein [Microbacterium trichothecenolyticum]|uniref:ABC-type glycerol-3-phosphate transport system substrate-binding protein n=2 Tax=Microbacterium trichothecenolyticum TaxID=69370 RepID=A0ABU0TQD0_MICTR|nr:extracellular solute-binding protein [Microbacterium trichothecenolyticum]MDQ1121869.1 ABC-type glycerol-3-phosphate transport system substrate-binding protein [Microbacterium trichothecenolyticum]
MPNTRTRLTALVAVVGVTALALTGCGAGSRTGNANSTSVACDVTAPSEPLTVNVLAYNSSAIDPYTDTMATSCSHDGVTVKHDPIDFGGQVTKTTATLSAPTGTYDIVETYSYVIPTLASTEKLQPLDDLYAKYKDQYKLGDLSPSMLQGMSYDGKLYALPMQAQMFVMAYRSDVFSELGLAVPTTFDEMAAAAEKIKAAGLMQYPIALPWLATADITTGFQAAMNSLDADFVDDSGAVTIESDAGEKALNAMLALKPYMDPQVTTFDQPKVQQQLYNGTAAMAIMFSGRMTDLTKPENTSLSDSFAFAAPPKVSADAPYAYDRLSIDGWSIPFNTSIDHDLLFTLMAASVSEDASKASVPAAYPAREGLVTESNTPYGKAANESIASAMPTVVSPHLADISNAITPVLAKVINGELSVSDGLAQMQSLGEQIVG